MVVVIYTFRFPGDGFIVLIDHTLSPDKGKHSLLAPRVNQSSQSLSADQVLNAVLSDYASIRVIGTEILTLFLNRIQCIQPVYPHYTGRGEKVTQPIAFLLYPIFKSPFSLRISILGRHGFHFLKQVDMCKYATAGI
jgi:hypothetical protein